MGKRLKALVLLFVLPILAGSVLAVVQSGPVESVVDWCGGVVHGAAAWIRSRFGRRRTRRPSSRGS
jgi:hypothetical protein